MYAYRTMYIVHKIFCFHFHLHLLARAVNCKLTYLQVYCVLRPGFLFIFMFLFLFLLLLLLLLTILLLLAVHVYFCATCAEQQPDLAKVI